MQLVDKHDTQSPASENWRTKISPIPSFLQDADKHDLFPADEKDERSPIMKGILYTILTATIGVLVGYLVSYLMRSPQASTIQALEELASSVKAQSSTVLAGGKGTDKQGDSKATPSANKAAPPSSPAAAVAPTAAPAAITPPPAPVVPAAPGVSAAPAAPTPSPSAPPAPAAGDKAKDAAPAPAAAPAAPAPAPAAPAAKKPVPQGPVFLKGTNPYGPPPLVEQDIFDASSTLRIEYDPSTPQPPPPYTGETVDTPTFQQLLQDPVMPAPQASFHVQLGAFSSRLHATQFANRLQEKGYEVNIYEGRAKNHGTWYLVRLDKDFDHVTALETAKNIHATEKFLPMVVQPTDTEKKLR